VSCPVPHPKMFEDDDPFLHRVREMALALPGAAEKVSHGRPAFYTKKVFAYYGGSEKVDGEWVQHPRCVLVLPGPDELPSLVQDERYYVPGYLGAYGWIGFELPPLRAARATWAEVGELLDASFRNTAGKRLVAELDARG
jgi:hypothetical protein